MANKRERSFIHPFMEKGIPHFAPQYLYVIIRFVMASFGMTIRVFRIKGKEKVLIRRHK